MYERFTDRARKVLQSAKQEAQRFNHEYIGTEHILLGLVKEGSGMAADVLRNLEIDLGAIRTEVEKIVVGGPDAGMMLGNMPQTPRAKKVIEYAMQEARDLQHNYVGTEHLLLGLLREQEGVAAQVLMNLGLKLEDVRQEVLDLLAHGMDAKVCPGSQREAKPRSESQELPGPVQESVRELRAQIESLSGEKEAAVAAQDFDRAGHLRDMANKLGRRVRAILGKWPAAYVIDPAWLAWNDGTVRKLAKVIQKEQHWDNLPILADALEEAGCTDRRILDHCRQPAKHPYGCWVIDLLLDEAPQVSG